MIDRSHEASQSWVVPLAVLITGMFMSLLDMSIINVALPTMARDFAVTNEDIEWVATAYTLALGVVVPLSGWLGDRFGLARVYAASMMLFAFGSALCGLAWDLGSEIVFRILQAVPGGVLPVAALSMVYKIVPRERIGTAMGMYGIGVAFAPAVGPTLGGYLVEYVDWRLIFFINVPLGVVGAVAAHFLLPRVDVAQRLAFDWWGFLTGGYGLFALLLATSEGESWGWDSYPILLLVVSALFSLALFVVIELEVEHPLIELRVFAHWTFVNSLLLIGVLSVGMFALLFYVPLFLQEVQGIQPLRAGLILLPEAVVLATLMPVAGKLYDLVGPRWPAMVGLAIAAYGTYLLCGITPDTPSSDIVLWTCVRAIGNSLALIPIMTAGLAAIPVAYAGSGSAVNNIAQRVSSALGLAGLTVIVSNNSDQLLADRSALLPATSDLPELQALRELGPAGLYALYRELQGAVITSAYADAFLVCTFISIGGVLLAAFMRKPQAPALPVEPSAEAEPTPPRERLAVQ
ncbi:DHA2 family efflux MFS transporter permease subunit [Pseudonocardia eucalypti]|uniref:DHA2 family efflux MFS transporter permease subunit n=1 Tax=Pseudonocardia eucalypti TaxID=648755 RepID=A0ABP9QFV3_9PSEU|nr:EmrB/QacA subfamily drug resistance transporter [Pseudonocardia eucalypti]